MRAQRHFFAWHGEAERRKTCEEIAKDDLELHSRDGMAQALVWPIAEREMCAGVTLKVHLVRILKRFRIAVSSSQLREHTFTGPDHLSTDLNIFEHRALYW